MSDSSVKHELHEQFVAYLDGELKPEHAQRMEAMLAKNPAARRDVDALVRTWDMLDELDSVQASDGFTQRTLDSVAVMNAIPKPTRPIQTTGRQGSRHRGGFVLAGWAACIVLCAVIGFVATNGSTGGDANVLLQELPLIERLHMYQEIREIRFLEELGLRNIFASGPVVPRDGTQQDAGSVVGETGLSRE